MAVSPPMPRHAATWLLIAAAAWLLPALPPFQPIPAVYAQSDLDAFMRRVMERRDDNWRRLQQYVLNEREQVEVRGPGGLRLWGDRREYTWYVRDGFFIRSPLVANGVTIGDADRRAYEERFLRRERLRDQRARENPGAADAGRVPSDLDGFIRQSREPQFISSAYFLRFTFDQGQYAFVGPEVLDGVQTLRVEYYPTLLFSDNDNRRRPRSDSDRATTDEQIRTLINKGSRITLWILPESHQIVRYTFSNVDLDFFPAQWLVNVAGVEGSMTMGQPFPDVWLPDRLVIEADLMFAFGPVDVRYQLDYDDYRQADVTSTIRIPDGR